MNSYIKAQILNITTMTKTFEQACEMAAMKDDGKISREEEKQAWRHAAASGCVTMPPFWQSIGTESLVSAPPAGAISD